MILKRWIEIQNQFLTNKPKDAPMPRGQDWEYFLWAKACSRVRTSVATFVRRRKYLHVLRGPTRQSVDAQLRRLVKSPGVRVLKGRRAA